MDMHIPRMEAWDRVPICEAIVWRNYAIERNPWGSPNRASRGYVALELESILT